MPTPGEPPTPDDFDNPSTEQVRNAIDVLHRALARRLAEPGCPAAGRGCADPAARPPAAAERRLA